MSTALPISDVLWTNSPIWAKIFYKRDRFLGKFKKGPPHIGEYEKKCIFGEVDLPVLTCKEHVSPPPPHITHHTISNIYKDSSYTYLLLLKSISISYKM